MGMVEIKRKFEELSKKWERLFELLQSKRKLKELAKTKLKKPVAAKLKQIKEREKLRRIGLFYLENKISFYKDRK